MGIFSCILHRRILGTLAGRHKNSRAAISPAFAAGRRLCEGKVWLVSGPPRAGCPCGPPCGGVAASAAAAARAHGRRGAAAGEPAGRLFSLRRPFQTLFGISCPGSGPDRGKRQYGPLRASNCGARAMAGPEMSPAGHPPSAGPARSPTLQPLGERVNRTCGQSCSVRRRPLCDRREAGPAETGPAGPPGASQLEAGQPPGLAVLRQSRARGGPCTRVEPPTCGVWSGLGFSIPGRCEGLP